jgi:DNA-binding transcriptional regulator/RsmH inhibitor MraZ
MFLGEAVFLEIDDKGIITLPPKLMEYARLTVDFVIVGQGEYLEVWSPDQWRMQQSELNDAQANAQRFSAFTIAIH